MSSSSSRRAVPLLLLSLSASLLSCSRDGTTVPAPKSVAVAAPSATVAPPDTNVEDQLLPLVSAALRRAKILTRPDQCYAYRFDSGAGQSVYTVDVSENHRHAECGGDPQTQPHLFTVLINKTTRALSLDAHSPGNFQPLTP